MSNDKKEAIQNLASTIKKISETKEEPKKEKEKVIKMYYDKNTRLCIDRAVKTNKAVLLIGETGTGKTGLVKEIAKEQGRELVRINLTGQTGVDEIIGKYLANASKGGTYWIDGALVTAMKKGQWIVLDEINMALPEVLAKLHSLMDDDRKIFLNEKDDEIVIPHKDFRLFATMNPSDEYAGTKELNKAFISRFPVVLITTYSENEARIITDRAEVEDQLASMLVMAANELREHKRQGKISYTCSTRDLISCAELIAEGVPADVAFSVAIVNKAPTEEQEAIGKVVSMVTNEGIHIKSINRKFKTIENLIEEIEKEVSLRDRMEKDMNNYKEAYAARCEELNLALNQLRDEKLKNQNLKVLTPEKIEQLKTLVGKIME